MSIKRKCFYITALVLFCGIIVTLQSCGNNPGTNDFWDVPGIVMNWFFHTFTSRYWGTLEEVWNLPLAISWLIGSIAYVLASIIYLIGVVIVLLIELVLMVVFGVLWAGKALFSGMFNC